MNNQAPAVYQPPAGPAPAPSAPCPTTVELLREILDRVRRVETRVVKLLQASGMDKNGSPFN